MNNLESKVTDNGEKVQFFIIIDNSINWNKDIKISYLKLEV